MSLLNVINCKDYCTLHGMLEIKDIAELYSFLFIDFLNLKKKKLFSGNEGRFVEKKS